LGIKWDAKITAKITENETIFGTQQPNSTPATPSEIEAVFGKDADQDDMTKKVVAQAKTDKVTKDQLTDLKKVTDALIKAHGTPDSDTLKTLLEFGGTNATAKKQKIWAIVAKVRDANGKE